VDVKQPRLKSLVLAAAAAMVLAGCASDELADGEKSPTTQDGGAVTISGQSFPEATLVAAMYQQILEKQGYEVDLKLVDTRDVYMAEGQFPEDIQIVPEYVGGVVDFLNAQANGPDAKPLTTNDPVTTVAAAQQLLDAKGITLLRPSAAADQNAFFVTKEYAETNDVVALSDLKGKEIVLAAAEDCPGRPDCEGGLTETYGIDITKVLKLGFASEQTYQSVIDGESQLGLTSTTDGTLASQGLQLLEDDLGIQTAQNLVPAVSSEWLQDNPEAGDALTALMAALTTENLTELNGRISVDREQPEAVAKEFLAEQGLG
jgi:osmoprotectant transport system substrate-binding protein